MRLVINTLDDVGLITPDIYEAIKKYIEFDDMPYEVFNYWVNKPKSVNQFYEAAIKSKDLHLTQHGARQYVVNRLQAVASQGIKEPRHEYIGGITEHTIEVDKLNALERRFIKEVTQKEL